MWLVVIKLWVAESLLTTTITLGKNTPSQTPPSSVSQATRNESFTQYKYHNFASLLDDAVLQDQPSNPPVEKQHEQKVHTQFNQNFVNRNQHLQNQENPNQQKSNQENQVQNSPSVHNHTSSNQLTTSVNNANSSTINTNNSTSEQARNGAQRAFDNQTENLQRVSNDFQQSRNKESVPFSPNPKYLNRPQGNTFPPTSLPTSLSTDYAVTGSPSVSRSLPRPGLPSFRNGFHNFPGVNYPPGSLGTFAGASAGECFWRFHNCSFSIYSKILWCVCGNSLSLDLFLE